MGRKKLSPELENWLFLNYADKTNQELADDLSNMIKKENKKQLERLKHLLEEDFSEVAKHAIERKIASIEKFSGISVQTIKRYAKELHCPKKSRKHLIQCNQEKAKATNLKKWLMRAEKVEHKMEWLRTLVEKDVRYCFVENDGDLKSFRVSINRFNRYEGYDRGVYLTSEHIPEASLLRVNALLYRT